MGKIIFDSIVDSINSKVGNFVYSEWKGRPVMRKHSRKKRNMTPLQMEVCNAFGVVAATWKSLPDVVKDTWKPRAVGIAKTEYNIFIGENSNRQRTGRPYVLTGSPGVQSVNDITVSSPAAGTLSIGFTPPAGPFNLTIILQAIEEASATGVLRVFRDAFTGAVPVAIAGLESGTECFVYCISSAGPLEEALAITGYPGFRVTIM